MAENQTKLKLLAVDDDDANLMVLEEILEDDYQIMSVTSGEEAISVVNDYMPDIILLDIMMDGMDGYEVCEKVRSDQSLVDVKILLLSAKSTLDDKLKGYEVGANDYLTKPFDMDELLAKVNVFGSLRRTEEQQKEIEKQLRINEQRYRTILEHTQNGYFEVDLDGRLLFANESFCKILGYSFAELVAMKSNSLCCCQFYQHSIVHFNRIITCPGNFIFMLKG